MPTVTITRDVLFEKLGQKYSEEEFEDECFDFGVELDDVVEEEEVSSKNHFLACFSCQFACHFAYQFLAKFPVSLRKLCMNFLTNYPFLGNQVQD